MKIESHHATHVGRVRHNNEDAFYDNDFYRLLAVADGMGGHPAGEVASRMACQAVHGIDPHALARSPEDALKQAFDLANAAILENGRLRHERLGMGTTLTVCAVEGEALHVAHVGDSAAFLLRGTRIKPLTVPHGQGNMLGNCLGVSEISFKGTDYCVENLLAGDVILLCTDGLTGYFDARQISRFATSGSFEHLADRLVQAALDAGGQDNVTVVAAKIL